MDGNANCVESFEVGYDHNAPDAQTLFHLPVSTSKGGGFLETAARRKIHSVLEIAAVVSAGAIVFLDEWLLAANLGMTHYRYISLL